MIKPEYNSEELHMIREKYGNLLEDAEKDRLIEEQRLSQPLLNDSSANPERFALLRKPLPLEALISRSAAIYAGEEELRKILEKYGDQLEDVAKEKLMEEYRLAQPSWRDLLPPEAPISHSVWERGFYCKGGGIKYRTSVWQSLISYKNMPIVLIIIQLVFLFLILVALTNVQLDKPGTWVAFFFVIPMLFMQSIINLRNYSLNPDAEINIDKKILKAGRFFIKEIPFAEVSYLHVYKTRGELSTVIGTVIVLGAVRKKDTENMREIIFATFHPWEEHDVEIVKNAILCLLGKELEIKHYYVLNRQEVFEK